MRTKLNPTIRAAACCLAACLLSVPVLAETPEERGDRAYRQRAAGFAGPFMP